MASRRSGKILVIILLTAALVAGAGLWWLQNYAYYNRLSAPAEEITLVSRVTGLPEAVPYADFRAIDSVAAPIGFRSCFTLLLRPGDVVTSYEPYADAEPLIAPSWFDCYDAALLGEALESGAATAWLGRRDVVWGFDRVIVLFPDGRAFGWNQVNRCGDAVFSRGEPVPEDCPPLPERLQ